jgi:hypothetical protein
MLHGEKTFTDAGNMRAPSMELYLQWIVDAWEQLPKELIIKSFKGCGLTLALDGSEGDKIHCFKSDGPIPDGLELFQQKREDLQADEMARWLEEVDLAEDENNGHESDVSIDFAIE